MSQATTPATDGAMNTTLISTKIGYERFPHFHCRISASRYELHAPLRVSRCVVTTLLGAGGDRHAVHVAIVGRPDCILGRDLQHAHGRLGC